MKALVAKQNNLGQWQKIGIGEYRDKVGASFSDQNLPDEYHWEEITRSITFLALEPIAKEVLTELGYRITKI